MTSKLLLAGVAIWAALAAAFLMEPPLTCEQRNDILAATRSDGPVLERCK